MTRGVRALNDASYNGISLSLCLSLYPEENRRHIRVERPVEITRGNPALTFAFYRGGGGEGGISKDSQYVHGGP